MTDRLVHFSTEPITELDPSYTYDRAGYNFKPAGFWVSVEGNGDGWSDWCRGEQFRLDGLTYPHGVELDPAAAILRLTTADEIRAFTEEWRTKFDRTRPWVDTLDGIDWGRLASSYQGIVISPYSWECRLEVFWYYGWDCASGCIWDLSAITSIVPMERVTG